MKQSASSQCWAVTPSPWRPQAPQPPSRAPRAPPVLTPSSLAIFCHCRWPCLAARAFSWSTSCPLHSCLLMLGCSQFCQNFRISSALRPPSNCTNRETQAAGTVARRRLAAWHPGRSGVPVQVARTHTPRSGGSAPSTKPEPSHSPISEKAAHPSGAGLTLACPEASQQVWRPPGTQPDCLNLTLPIPAHALGCQDGREPPSAQCCPTYVNVRNLLPVVAVQPVPQQGLLWELPGDRDRLPGSRRAFHASPQTTASL